jgi:WD40 repeat protein
MREAALCDATCRALGNGENNSKDKENKLTGPLDEYMKGVADIAFSQAGLHLAARDYCQIRLWDLRVEGKPLARYPILPRHQLLAHLYDRYEDGVPLDRFRCTFLGGETLRLATGTYSDQCIIWDVNGDSGGNVVVHVGKDRSSSPVQFQSQLLTAESDYGARQKRRKCVDDFIETPDFGEEYRDGVVSSSPISNVVVRPFGNTRVKTFIGDMKTEYMVQYDNHEMGDGMDELFTNNGYSSPISFGRKVSALVVDGPRDVLAVAATGQLFVYDIKR